MVVNLQLYQQNKVWLSFFSSVGRVSSGLCLKTGGKVAAGAQVLQVFLRLLTRERCHKIQQYDQAHVTKLTGKSLLSAAV